MDQTFDCSGEKLLLASIIRRAAYDIALYKNSRRLKLRRRYVEAYKWMFGYAEEGDFTSFLSICTVLDLDPEDLRRKTLRLKRSDIKRIDIVSIYG